MARAAAARKAAKSLGVDLSPEAQEEVTPEGGKQSVVTCALDVVPSALLRVGRVVYEGEKKREKAPQLAGKENWRKITARMHARHAVTHLVAWLANDRSDAHLEHAAVRLLFAIEKELEK